MSEDYHSSTSSRFWNWSDDFGHTKTGSGAKRGVVLRREMIDCFFFGFFFGSDLNCFPNPIIVHSRSFFF